MRRWPGPWRRPKRGDPLAPVTVVVPNHYVGLAARRALGRREHDHSRGTAAVAFQTAYSLAEHLGGAEMADQGRRGVSNTVIAAGVRAALRRDPGHFRGVETHPATERALTRAHRQLSELDRDQLAALSQQSPRAADVVRVHTGGRRSPRVRVQQRAAARQSGRSRGESRPVGGPTTARAGDRVPSPERHRQPGRPAASSGRRHRDHHHRGRNRRRRRRRHRASLRPKARRPP